MAFKHFSLIIIVGLFASYTLEHLLALEDRLPLTILQHFGYSLLFTIFPLLIGTIVYFLLLHFKKIKIPFFWYVVWGCYVTMFLVLASYFLCIYLFY
jgi:hypothetical protein